MKGLKSKPRSGNFSNILSNHILTFHPARLVVVRGIGEWASMQILLSSVNFWQRWIFFVGAALRMLQFACKPYRSLHSILAFEDGC